MTPGKYNAAGQRVDRGRVCFVAVACEPTSQLLWPTTLLVEIRNIYGTTLPMQSHLITNTIAVSYCAVLVGEQRLTTQPQPGSNASSTPGDCLRVLPGELFLFQRKILTAGLTHRGGERGMSIAAFSRGFSEYSRLAGSVPPNLRARRSMPHIARSADSRRNSLALFCSGRIG